MSTNPKLALRTAKVPAKSIALPVEHGAWGFLFEPLAAGLLLAPSLAAPFITLLTVGAFLTRQPLKFLLGDWLQKRRLPRTEIATRFVLIFGGIAMTGMFDSVFFGTLDSLIPFEVTTAIVVYLIIQDAARRTRELLPEILAAFALASSVAVLALADAHRVGVIDEAEHGLQVVVAVGALAEHVEKEVELPRRGECLQRHWEIAKRSSMPW